MANEYLFFFFVPEIQYLNVVVVSFGHATRVGIVLAGKDFLGRRLRWCTCSFFRIVGMFHHLGMFSLAHWNWVHITIRGDSEKNFQSDRLSIPLCKPKSKRGAQIENAWENKNHESTKIRVGNWKRIRNHEIKHHTKKVLWRNPTVKLNCELSSCSFPVRAGPRSLSALTVLTIGGACHDMILSSKVFMSRWGYIY